MAGRKKSNHGKAATPQAKAGRAAGASKSHESRQKLLTRIGRCDREITRLANQRAELSRQLHDSIEPGTPQEYLKFENSQRRLVDDPVKTNSGPLPNDAIRSVLSQVVGGCLQLLRPLQVGFLGPVYSYSHLATIEHFGDQAELIPLATIATVFEEVAAGNLQHGLVPLENSTDGKIADTLDMLARSDVCVCGEVQLRIHHHLIGSGPRSKIASVHSKPQAISQCRHWLSQNLPEARLVEEPSTAAAARLAKEDSTVAAIASQQAAVHHHLRIHASAIEDLKNNTTRFAVLGLEWSPRTGRDKTSLLFRLAHRAGALAEAMAVFRRNRLNLTWIESLPIPGHVQEYHFFVELDGHPSELRVRRALALLEKKTEHIQVLGAYPTSLPIG